MKKHRLINLLKTFILFFLIDSCSYPEISRDELVYENDFEANELNNINGGGISLYDNNNVIGNFNRFPENDKPDKWIMELDPDMDLIKDTSSDRFVTTFSNSPCFGNYCLRQSYPENYPYENNPKTGSFLNNLSELKSCKASVYGGDTTLYKIEKTFKHSGNAVAIRFYDELYQPNAINWDTGEVESKCDESWSLDNLKVRVISYK